MDPAIASLYLSTLSWTQNNAGVISVVGALIIFFSWMVTNTLGQKYSRLKSSIESAQSTFRLQTKLNELRNSLNSLAMEVVQQKNSSDASIFMPGRTGDSEIDRMRTNFSLTRLSAHQVNELMDFTVETHSFSCSVGTTTEASQKIESLLKEVDQIYSKAIAKEREVETTWQPGTSPLEEKFTVEAQNYIRFIRNEAIPHVPRLYKEIVSASNTRHEQGRRLTESKRRFEKATKAALWLYVLGSVLALGGQYLDKTKPKAQEAPTVQQKSLSINERHTNGVALPPLPPSWR
jgi:hypothetical protein